MLRYVRVLLSPAAAALVLLIGAGAVSAQDGEMPGLTGGFRNVFVQAGVQACMSYARDPRLADLPQDLVAPSCTCVANQVADRIRQSEAQRLLLALLGGGRFDSPADIELAQTVMIGSVVACVGELGLTARQR